MPDSSVRVALLARAGDAREQLRRALTDLGADVVAEGDPAELDPGTVAGQQPAVVVVSLEPAIEDSLVEFDDLLAMPGVQVIYDDAEVTSQLDGWDLARWARHLASKLAGTDGVLPPAPDDSYQVQEVEISLEPGAPRTPAEEMDHAKLEDYAVESLALSEWVPTTPSLTEVDVAPAPASVDVDAELDLDLDLDMAGLEEALSPHAGTPEAEPAAVAGAESVDTLDFDAGATDDGSDADLGDFLDLSVADSLELDAMPEDDVRPGVPDEPLLVNFEVADEPIKFSSFTDEEDLSPSTVDDDVAALAAQLDAFEANDTRAGPREPDFALADEPDLPLDDESAAAEPESLPSQPAAPRAASGGFGNLELMPMEGDAPAPEAGPAAPAVQEPVRVDFGSSLSLADAGASMSEPVAPPPKTAEPSSFEEGAELSLEGADDAGPALPATPAATETDFDPRPTVAAAPASEKASDPAPTVAAAPGVLLVIAGLGGPDGVRQLLSALPVTLPVPVLLYQHLDTGKHERLVGQLSKASKPPVELAVEGASAAPGRVSVLPPGLGVNVRDSAFAFAPTGSLSALVEALPAADSIVLVLSGGESSVVAAVLALKRAGGRVLAQDPASCFDPSAPQALISAGATTGSLPELARLIIERWS